MTVSVTVTTPDNKGARVILAGGPGGNAIELEPNSSQTYHAHDCFTVMVEEMEPAAEASATDSSGGSGHGDPDGPK